MHQPPFLPTSGSWLLALSREASKLGVSSLIWSTSSAVVLPVESCDCRSRSGWSGIASSVAESLFNYRENKEQSLMGCKRFETWPRWGVSTVPGTLGNALVSISLNLSGCHKANTANPQQISMNTDAGCTGHDRSQQMQELYSLVLKCTFWWCCFVFHLSWRFVTRWSSLIPMCQEKPREAGRLLIHVSINCAQLGNEKPGKLCYYNGAPLLVFSFFLFFNKCMGWLCPLW